MVKKKKRIDILMYALTAVVLLIYLADIGYNYIYYNFWERDDPIEMSPGKMLFMYIKAAIDFILMILIVWQTVVLIRMMKILGNLLAKE